MNSDNKNFILAIVLSGLIMIGWQYFYAAPHQQKLIAQQQAAQQLAEQQKQAAQPESGSAPNPAPGTPATVPGGAVLNRDEAIAAAPRLKIDTPSLEGSISLKGAQLDDLHLRHYRETVDPTSPTITLLSPSGTENGFFAEEGWVNAAGQTAKLPDAQTVWSAPEGAVLTPANPVTLTWDNGEGLVFSKTISVDNDYMFTITRSVENRGATPVTLFPYARVQRQGTPATQNIYVLHEGLIGVLNGALEEFKYKKLKEEPNPVTKDSTGGWVGFTDKYWAVALIPALDAKVDGTMRWQALGGRDSYQADYLDRTGVTVAPGAKADYSGRIFAGAKVVKIINGYKDSLSIDHFDLMIDWGWFYFLTKPLFWLLEFIKGIVGNFGIAILLITVLVKGAFFPLANKSYESMTKMKKLQPEMERLKKLYPDDKMKQQQELMAIYKKEKVSPLSGCVPMIIQIPVFFSLYKVLFVTIEMRHAPFFGWIQDLSAADPTSLFNLFGLIPWTPPAFLIIGVWPLIMGVTMWVQMRLNPTPPDPVQQQLFNWMPVLFTYMLGHFPAGLVIYWAWNNTLSIAQQMIIMRRQGVEVDLLGNIRNSLPFLKRKGAE